jgi:hypothetical protein
VFSSTPYLEMSTKTNSPSSSIPTTERNISSAQEIQRAAEDGRLSKISPETIVKWIRSALDAEDLDSKIAFIKGRILDSATKIKAARSKFTPAEIAPEFRCFTNGSTVSIITAALLELSEEEKIATVDPGRAPVYSFL